MNSEDHLAKLESKFRELANDPLLLKGRHDPSKPISRAIYRDEVLRVNLLEECTNLWEQMMEFKETPIKQEIRRHAKHLQEELQKDKLRCVTYAWKLDLDPPQFN